MNEVDSILLGWDDKKSASRVAALVRQLASSVVSYNTRKLDSSRHTSLRTPIDNISSDRSKETINEKEHNASTKENVEDGINELNVILNREEEERRKSAKEQNKLDRKILTFVSSVDEFNNNNNDDSIVVKEETLDNKLESVPFDTPNVKDKTIAESQICSATKHNSTPAVSDEIIEDQSGDPCPGSKVQLSSDTANTISILTMREKESETSSSVRNRSKPLDDIEENRRDRVDSFEKLGDRLNHKAISSYQNITFVRDKNIFDDSSESSRCEVRTKKVISENTSQSASPNISIDSQLLYVSENRSQVNGRTETVADTTNEACADKISSTLTTSASESAKHNSQHHATHSCPDISSVTNKRSQNLAAFSRSDDSQSHTIHTDIPNTSLKRSLHQDIRSQVSRLVIFVSLKFNKNYRFKSYIY